MHPRGNWTYPNVLTVIAILCGVVTFILGLAGASLGYPFIFTGVGVLLCVADGVVADLTGQKTKLGDEKLQPAAGVALGVGGAVTLIVQHHWPIWVGIALFVVMCGFQTIDFVYNSSGQRRWRRAKRHQFYLHPLLTIAVLVVVLDSMAILLRPQAAGWLIFDAVLYVGAVSSVRINRLRCWLRADEIRRR